MLAVNGKTEKRVPTFNYLCVCRQPVCERFFKKCADRDWRYILRFKEGSIPTVAQEYHKLKGQEGNLREKKQEDGNVWYDYVTEIDYNGIKVNLAEYGESREEEIKKGRRKGPGKRKGGGSGS